jgi:hypothetical protein
LRTKKTNLISKIKERSKMENENVDDTLFGFLYVKKDYQLIVSILDRYQRLEFKESFINQFESLEMNENSLNWFILENFTLKIWELLKERIVLCNVKTLSGLAIDFLRTNEDPVEKLEILVNALKMENIQPEIVSLFFQYFPKNEMKITKLLLKTKFFQDKVDGNGYGRCSFVLSFLPADCVEYLIENGFEVKFDHLLSLMKNFKIFDLNEKAALYLKHDNTAKDIKSTKDILSIKCKYHSPKDLKLLSNLVMKILNIPE